MASAKSTKPPGWDFMPAPIEEPTPSGTQPGDSPLYPAFSKKGLAKGKFYIDAKTGDIMQVRGPNFSDVVYLSNSPSKTELDVRRNEYEKSKLYVAYLKESFKNFAPTMSPAGITGESPEAIFIETGKSKYGDPMGKTYSQEGLRREIAKATKDSELAKKVFDDAFKTVKSYESKSKKIKSTIDDLEANNQVEIDAGRNPKTSETKLQKLKAELEKAQKEEAAVKATPAGTQLTPATATKIAATKTAPSTTTTTTPATTTTTTAPATTPTTAPKTTPTTTPGATTTTTPGATTTTTTPQSTTTTAPAATPATQAKPSTGTPLMNNLQNPSSRNKVGATPSGASGGGGGTGGGGTGGGTGGLPATTTNNNKGGKKKKAPAVDYESLKVQFPQYAWILDLDPQYEDLKKITVDVINGPENGGITQERWNELAPGTSWFMDKATIAASRRVRNRFGDIPFANGGFSKLVSDTMNQKYDDATLDSAFYGEAFRRDPITGNYVNDAAAKTVLKSTNANKYRTYAKNMFSSVSDDTIVSLLTGEKTVEDFDRSLRTVAKNVYGNLAQQLDDPSMDMATIVRPWQEHAAKVLEMDPSQIDMTLPQFQIAYSGNTENGQTKALSIGEWNQKLRTDSIYNWKNTNTAKQGARELAFNLASAFGKII